jgi:hypothetical protein
MKNLNVVFTLFVFALALGMSEARASGGSCGQESGVSLTRMKSQDVTAAPVQKQGEQGSAKAQSAASKSKK